MSYKGLHKRAWAKDYFTSALPWQQRGTPVGVPLVGQTLDTWLNSKVGANDGSPYATAVSIQGGYFNPDPNLDVSSTDANVRNNARQNLISWLNNYKAQVSNNISFSINDMRLAWQVQLWMEKNARSGVRYPEFLKGQFGAAPRDERLDRPEYIGGTKTPIIISEVLQTSQTQSNAPLGKMAGHGISADRTTAGHYNVYEPGWIIGLLSFMPKAMYQDGLSRQFNRRSVWDYYFPVFRHLSEQAITQSEIFNYYNVQSNAQNHDTIPIFGYQGRYDEFRYRPNTVHGLFRTTLSYWHMGRKFTTAPLLNQNFINATNAEIYDLKRVMASQTEPMFLVTFGNRIKAVRPMPWMARPGLVDHV